MTNDADDTVRCSDGKMRSLKSSGFTPIPKNYQSVVPFRGIDAAPPSKTPWWRIALDICGLIPEVLWNIFPWFLCFAVLGVLAFLGFASWMEAKSSTFELHKNQWVCSMEHTDTSTALIPSGKSFVPIITSTTVCDRYDRRL